jgi:predicted nucleotidyltransferase
MRICGIVSEYNPFHTGHEWHIAQTRKITGADLVICAMSASFVQRGEPAVFDKWSRAACALLCGADAVVELPLLSAVQSAEGFAQGGVAILCALGAQAISFGSETDDIEMLTKAARALANETEAFRRALKAYLDEGISFPSARMKAVMPDAAEVLCTPNAILGVEYIKAIIQSGADITPYAVPRVGGAYHSADMSDEVPSATALRAALKAGDAEGALAAMPQGCRSYMRAQLEAGLAPAFPEAFDNALLFALRRNGRETIRSLHEVSEGLENRIMEAAQRCTSREALIAMVKTKRYTYTRISRILLYALLGVTRGAVRRHSYAPVDHIRVLGVKSPDVLSALSRTCRVPLAAGSAANSPYPALDAAATDVWALSQRVSPFRDGYRDFTQRLLIASQL